MTGAFINEGRVHLPDASSPDAPASHARPPATRARSGARVYLASRAHEAAMQGLTRGIREGAQLLVLTGAAGAGRSTVLRRLAGELSGVAEPVVCRGSGLEFGQLLYHLATELGLVHTSPTDRSGVGALANYLSQQARRPVLFLVDDADRLEGDALPQLLRLTQTVADARQPLHLVLAGERGLQPRLKREREAHPVVTRGIFVRIGRLTPVESAALVERVAAGADPSASLPVDGAAMRAIVEHGAGNAGRLVEIAAAARARAAAAGESVVTLASVEGAAGEPGARAAQAATAPAAGPRPAAAPASKREVAVPAAAPAASAARRRGSISVELTPPRIAGIAAGLLLAFAGLFVLLRGDDPPPPPPVAQTEPSPAPVASAPLPSTAPPTASTGVPAPAATTTGATGATGASAAALAPGDGSAATRADEPTQAGQPAAEASMLAPAAVPEAGTDTPELARPAATASSLPVAPQAPPTPRPAGAAESADPAATSDLAAAETVQVAAARQPEAPAPAPAAAAGSRDTPDTAARVSTLLSRARDAMVRDALTTPANDNAVRWTREALALEPGNRQAIALQREVMDRYLRWSDDALARKELERAESFVQRARTVADHATRDQLATIDVLQNEIDKQRGRRGYHIEAPKWLDDLSNWVNDLPLPRGER